MSAIFSKFEEGEKTEKISAIVSTTIGFGELLIAFATGSIALMADGILSFGDVGVSFIVFFG